MRSKRFEALDARPVNQDGFVSEWPEVGLIAMDSPNDPKPSIRIEGGKVVELDGKACADFDMLDESFPRPSYTTMCWPPSASSRPTASCPA